MNPQGTLAARSLRPLYNYRRYLISESIFNYKSSRWQDFNSFIPVFTSMSFPFPNLVLPQAGTAFQKIVSELVAFSPCLLVTHIIPAVMEGFLAG